MGYYCVHCARLPISHKKWKVGIRFCSVECKHDFHLKHYPNSQYAETKRYIKNGLIKHLSQSKELSPGWDVLERWGLNVLPKKSFKESSKGLGLSLNQPNYKTSNKGLIDK